MALWINCQYYQTLNGLRTREEVLKTYNRCNKCLDTFWMEIFPTTNNLYEDLTAFVQRISIMCHGNAALEGGLSSKQKLLFARYSRCRRYKKHTERNV